MHDHPHLLCKNYSRLVHLIPNRALELGVWTVLWMAISVPTVALYRSAFVSGQPCPESAECDEVSERECVLFPYLEAVFVELFVFGSHRDSER